MITNSKLSNYGCSSFLNNLSNNNLPGNLKTSAALNNKNLSNENTMNTSMDKVLYSGKIGKSNMKNYTGTPITEVEIVPSSSREYTIDDAINYQYNKTFSINLNEIMNGSSQSFSLRAPESAVPKEFIKNLKENGIQGLLSMQVGLIFIPLALMMIVQHIAIA
ncbi:MAG: hypothetical protein PHY44_07225 [Lachnospiraceae bacterium]|nr:hypothetical protein [Lachnospiraceae bacterium]